MKQSTKIVSSNLSIVPVGSSLAYGHFDTIHPGHIRYLRHAKTLGTQLVVAVQSDKDYFNNPLEFSLEERCEALSLLGIIDFIIPLEQYNLFSVLKQINPKTLVLGDQARANDFSPLLLDYTKENSISIEFHAGERTYASADLLLSTTFDLRRHRRQDFIQACNRQKISHSDLLNYSEQLSNARIAVIGDTIVDQFAACEAIGMSAEAPVIVVKELEKKNFIGAAAIVASHVRSFGATCDLISVVGDDSTAEFVSDYLLSSEIGNFLSVDPTRPTTFKKRYLVENQKLFRVSRLEDHSINSEIEEKVIDALNVIAPTIDGLIISDFVYGVITPQVLSHITSLRKQYGFQLFGDVQCSSQVGSILKFQNFTLLSPNEREARYALQNKDSGLEELSYCLMNSTSTNKLVMKLGSSGFICYEKKADGSVKSQPFPALSTNPVDVSGAGDSVLAVLATALSSNVPFMDAAALACCTASEAVETMGNLPVTTANLKKRINSLFG